LVDDRPISSGEISNFDLEKKEKIIFFGCYLFIKKALLPSYRKRKK